MIMALQGLSLICNIVSLVCFILVLVQMFKRDESKMGIICIATFVLCCGIGGLVAFVYGWIKVKEWDLKNIMIAWTAAIVLGSILGGVTFAMAAGAAAANAPNQFVDPNSMNLEIDMGDMTFPDPGNEN